MKARLGNLAATLQKLPPLTITAIGLCLIFTLGAADYVTPDGVSFTLFYLLAVALVGWGAGAWHAVLVSCIAIAVMSAVRFASHPGAPLASWVMVWNDSARLVVFSLAGWLTAEARGFTRHLNLLVEERTTQWKAEAEQHKTTSARLSEVVQRLEQITNNITEVFWLTDVSKARMDYISPGYEKLWGRKCEDLYRKPGSWLESVHPEDRATIGRRSHTEQAAGTYDVEYRIVRPDGSLRWVHDRAFPIRNDKGEAYRIAGLAEDITARKKAELTREVFLSLGTKLSVVKTPLEAGRAIFASADQLWTWDSASLDIYSPESDLVHPVVLCDVLNGQRQEVPPARLTGPPTNRLRTIMRAGPQLILRKPGDQEPTDCIRFGDVSRLSASIIVVPLHREGQVVGILSIQSYTPNHYTQEDLRTLQALADHCGAALDRIRAEEAVHLANESLERHVMERTAELHAANTALLRTNAVLQTINQGTDNLICVKDAEGKIILANPAMCHFLGKTEAELVGTDDLDFLPNPQQASHIRENNRRIVATGRSETMEETIDQPGRKWHCLFTKAPYRDPGGKVIGIIGIGIDITERKLAEQALCEARANLELRVQERTAELQAANSALRESEASLRAFLDALPEPALLLDRSGKVLIANPAVARSLNMPVGEIVGRNAFDLVLSPAAETRRAMFDQVIRTGELRQFEDSRGGRHFINYLAPVPDGEGHVSRTTALSIDITKRKRAEIMKEAFLTLGQRLSAARMPREAGEAIFAAADQLWEWHCATLDIYSPETDRIDSVLNYDIVDGQRQEVAWDTPSAKLTARMRRVMQGGPELILRGQPPAPEDDSVMIGDTSRPCSTIMCVPLRREGQPLGVLSVQSYSPNAYSEEDLQTLLVLAASCTGSLERILAEKALRESEQTYRALVETTGTGYLILDVRGRVLDANAEYIRLTGHKSLQEILDRTVLEWTAPHDREKNATEVETCIRTGTVRTLEIDYAGPDGVLRPVEINATLVQIANEPRILSLCWDITERKRAEEALRQREELNRTMLATAMDAFFALDFTLDPQGAIIDVNDAYCRMTGYSRDELLQMRLANLEADETPEAIAEHSRRIIATGAERFETQHRCKDGRIIRVEVSSSRLAGTNSRTFSFVRDITERKQAERALRQSETRYRTLAESSPDAIFIIDRDLSVQYVNSQAATLWRHAPEDIIGRRQSELFPPEVAARHARTLQQVMQTGENFRQDESIPYPAGELWHEVRLVPLRDERNNVTAVMGAVRDITERKRAEAALRDSEQRYHTLFELSPDGIVLEDTDGNILDVNHAICQSSGYSRKELLRGNVRVFVPPEDQAGVTAHLTKLRAGQSLEHEIWNLRKNGERRLMRLNEQPVTLPDGTQVILVVARDITESKNAQQRLTEALDFSRTLIQASTLGIAAFRASGQCILANKALAELTGGTVEQLLQQNFLRLDSWRRHGMLKLATEALATMQPRQGDFHSVTSFGMERTVTFHFAPFMSNAELHLMALLTDVTDRKHAESLLLAQRDLGAALSLTADLDTALDHLLQIVRRIGGIDCGGVFLISPATNTMDLVAQRGLATSVAKAVSHWAADPSQGSIVWKGRPVFTIYGNLLAPPDKPRPRERLRGIALLPLSHKGSVIGMLTLASHMADEIPVQTRLVIEAVAAQASGAIARIQAETERRSLEQQILEISDREQVRIGQDIHDSLCQHLVSLGFDANSLERQLSLDHHPDAAIARRLARFLDEAITEARQLSRGLFPIRLEAGGLGSALEELAKATCERFQVRCRFASRKPVFVKTRATAIHIYRIAQEAVNNAIKHSKASRILIHLSARGHELELKVEDDGIGLASDASRKRRGMGLHIMDYRARTIGGTLHLGPGSHGGTVISCCVPDCLG